MLLASKRHSLRLYALLLMLFVGSLLPNSAITKAVSTPNPNYGKVLLSGSDWLGGDGVDVYANGITKDDPYGGKYQCVELINRLYKTRKWITANWSGNGNQMFDTAASVGLTSKNKNEDITSVGAGDVIVFDGGVGFTETDAKGNKITVYYGHVAVVDSVDGTIVHTVSQNVGQTTEGTRKDVIWDKGAKTLFWSGFKTIGIVHAPTTSTSTTPTPVSPPPDNTVQKLLRNTQDNVNELYWYKHSDAYQSWYRPQGDGIHHTSMFSADQKDITDIAFVMDSDGRHRLFVATSHDVWLVQWYSGGGVLRTKLIANAGNISKIQKAVDAGGVDQLYVMTDQGVDEYWWRSISDVHGSRIISVANPVSFKKITLADGMQAVYVADRAYVRQARWGNGSGIQVRDSIHIAQSDIVSLDYSRDFDGKNRLYTGGSINSGVWEATWYDGGPIAFWQLTGDHDIVAIQKWIDAGGNHVVYVAKKDSAYEYWWIPNTQSVHGSATVTGLSDVHAIMRGVNSDGAQALDTAAGTNIFESWWVPGGAGVHTGQIE